MTPSSPEARRLGTPSWLDLRLVLGVVLVLASVLIGTAVVSGADDTRPVLAATHDLAAGTVLQSGDVEVVDTRLPDDSIYVRTTDAAVGRTLGRSIGAGELLAADAVATTAAGTTLAVPFAAGAAPQLRAGQRIEVWLSTRRCAFVVLLEDVTVQSVRGDGTSYTGGTGAQNAVIRVAPELAGRVVAALGLEGVTLRAGVLAGGSDPVTPSSSTPSAPSSAPGPASTGGATAGAGLPADLATCAGTSGG